jgi:hypothetical protein
MNLVFGAAGVIVLMDNAGIELLGVRVDLEQLHPRGSDALNLGDRGVAVIGMDGRDRDKPGVRLGERDDRVVLRAHFVDLARKRLMGPPNHITAATGSYPAAFDWAR